MAVCHFPFLAAASFPQQEILHDEFSIAGSEWSATTARYFAISGFWAGLDFDDVVEGVAILALEKRLACRRKATRTALHHIPPPVSFKANLKIRSRLIRSNQTAWGS
jgi:hypothetical protein